MNRTYAAMKWDGFGVTPAGCMLDKRRTRAARASAMMERIAARECPELCDTTQRVKHSGATPGRNDHVDA